MGGYIRGQTMVCLFAGLFIWLGLAITGFDSALLVGMVAGTFNLVPYLGTALALTLAILLALNMSLWTVVWVLVLFGVEQFIEGNFVSPYFLSRQVELHPLAVMAALVVGANLAGILGAMVAVPIVAGLNVIARELYVKPARGRPERA
jgi:predicted PurR-regulated permease PerM